MLNLKKYLLAVPAVVAIALLASCGTTKGDNTAHYDSITKTCKLDKSFAGKSFIDDGIGEATLAACTDGDTTRFELKTNDGESVIIRYHSIDTPESTGSVEKWGKAASLFNEGILTKAKSIVLEATGPKAVHDSYGTRYLGYVWYKETETSEYKLLNLEMVENGFSTNHGDGTSEFPYNSYFKKAEDFARSSKLRLFSDEDDPLYSTDPIDITLKEFWANPDKYYDKEHESGAKIRTELYLTSVYVSQSGTYTFTGKQYNPETNEVTEINVYAGYASAAASGMPIGNLYRVIGNIQYHNGYQISGLKYASLVTGDEHTKPIKYNYFVKFDETAVNGDAKYSQKALYTSLTITAISGNEITGTARRFDNSTREFVTETTEFKLIVKENIPSTLAVGDVVKLEGLRLDSTKDEITVVKATNIVKK